MRTISPYRFNHLSDVFTFGVYRGSTLSDVIDTGSGYETWALHTIKRFLLEDSVMEEIRQIYPNQFCSPTFEQKRQWNLEHWSDGDKDDCPEDDYDDCEPCGWEEDEPTYDCYRGTWAQDEMGYSDDDIDTIFDGDPDAYWNID